MEAKKDFQKLAEDIEVISAVIKKTSCDIAEISSMFLWIGAVLFARQVFMTALSFRKVTAENAVLYQLCANAVRGIGFLAEIAIFIVCFVKCWRRRNKSSINLMEMWGVILFVLLPFLEFSRYYINSRFSVWWNGLTDALIENHIVYSQDFVTYIMDARFLAECLEVLLILLGIFMVGAFANNRVLKRASLALMAVEVVLVVLAVLGPGFFENGLEAFVIISTLCETLGMLLCGILLKLDKRRVLNGIE